MLYVVPMQQYDTYKEFILKSKFANLVKWIDNVCIYSIYINIIFTFQKIPIKREIKIGLFNWNTASCVSSLNKTIINQILEFNIYHSH